MRLVIQKEAVSKAYLRRLLFIMKLFFLTSTTRNKIQKAALLRQPLFHSGNILHEKIDRSYKKTDRSSKN